MSRKVRSERSKKERTLAIGAKPVPSAIPSDGANERLEPGRILSPGLPSGATQAAFGTPTSLESLERDERSVPPVDIDSHFFGAVHDYWEPPAELDGGRDPHSTRKMSPSAARRRAHLTKYVQLAVALSSAVCIAAVVKASVTSGHPLPPRSASVAEAPKAVAAAAPARSGEAPALAPEGLQAVAPSAVGSATPAVSATPTAEDKPAPAALTAPRASHPDPASSPAISPAIATASSAAPSPSPIASAAAAAPTEPAAASPESPPRDPMAAAKAKAASANALERGNLAVAIDAGERSVALDPTDGEAWLVLGAAYQQKGDAKGAVRAFKACLREGKRGPKGECAAMLR